MVTEEKKISAQKILRMVDILKALAHPIRLSIVECLQVHVKLSVSELMEKTGHEQSLISHHLIKMKDKGLLTAEREGKNILYSLTDTHITNVFDCLEKCNLP